MHPPRGLFLSISLILFSGVGCSDSAVLDSPPSFVEQLDTMPQNVLWIGAHPDDETFAMPLLADLCLRGGVRCHFLVLTDGGKGNCQLSADRCGYQDAGGAPPGSLGEQRLAEHAAVAQAIAATVRAPALEDSSSNTLAGVLTRWEAQLGGTDPQALTRARQEVLAAITASNADAILTFDPRHGMYCHPDHRAASLLAILAAMQSGFDLSRVLMLENTSPYLSLSGELTMRAWVPEDPALLTYDAHAADTWSAMAGALSLYPTQFRPEQVQALASMQVTARKASFLPLSAALVDGRFPPSAYDALCTDPWNGRGTCPRADGSLGPCW